MAAMDVEEDLQLFELAMDSKRFQHEIDHEGLDLKNTWKIRRLTQVD